MNQDTLSADEESTELAKPLSQDEQLEKDVEKAVGSAYDWIMDHIHFGWTTWACYGAGIFWWNRFFGLDLIGVLLWLFCTGVTWSLIVPLTIPLDILLQPFRSWLGLNPVQGINYGLREILDEQKKKRNAAV